jgi:hypothetical protein
MNSIVPYANPLEQHFMWSSAKIEAAARKTLK